MSKLDVMTCPCWSPGRVIESVELDNGTFVLIQFCARCGVPRSREVYPGNPGYADLRGRPVHLEENSPRPLEPSTDKSEPPGRPGHPEGNTLPRRFGRYLDDWTETSKSADKLAFRLAILMLAIAYLLHAATQVIDATLKLLPPR